MAAGADGPGGGGLGFEIERCRRPRLLDCLGFGVEDVPGLSPMQLNANQISLGATQCHCVCFQQVASHRTTPGSNTDSRVRVLRFEIPLYIALVLESYTLTEGSSKSEVDDQAQVCLAFGVRGVGLMI